VHRSDPEGTAADHLTASVCNAVTGLPTWYKIATRPSCQEDNMSLLTGFNTSLDEVGLLGQASQAAFAGGIIPPGWTVLTPAQLGLGSQYMDGIYFTDPTSGASAIVLQQQQQGTLSGLVVPESTSLLQTLMARLTCLPQISMHSEPPHLREPGRARTNIRGSWPM